MGDIGRPPRVQLIVNAAVASKCADVALAAGGAPVMGCTTAEEARECASKVDVTLLNFGTPTTEEIANAVVDARAVVVVLRLSKSSSGALGGDDAAAAAAASRTLLP